MSHLCGASHLVGRRAGLGGKLRWATGYRGWWSCTTELDFAFCLTRAALLIYLNGGQSPPVSCERRRARNFPPASSGLDLWGGVLSGYLNGGCRPHTPGSSGPRFWRSVLSAPSSLHSLHAKGPSSPVLRSLCPSLLRAQTSKKLPILACAVICPLARKRPAFSGKSCTPACNFLPFSGYK